MAHYVIQCHDGDLVMEQDTFDEIRLHIPYFYALRNFKQSTVIEWLPPLLNDDTRVLFSRDQLRRLLVLVQFGCIKSLLTTTLFQLSTALGGIECIQNWNWLEEVRYDLYKEDRVYRDKELGLMEAYENGIPESMLVPLELHTTSTYPDYVEMYPTNRDDELQKDTFFIKENLLLHVSQLRVYSVLKMYPQELWVVGDALMRILNGMILTEYKLCMTTTPERADLILNDIYTSLIVDVRYMVRTPTDIIFYMTHTCPFTVSLTLYKDIQHALLHTDMDCWALATDGDHAVALPRCIRSLVHHCIVVDPRFCNESYATHLSDMWQKGVHIVCPGYKNQWEKYIHTCDTDQLDTYPGLAKLMAYMYNRVRKPILSVEDIISKEIERVHGKERREWYQALLRIENQELFFTEYPVTIPLIVSTHWPDITAHQMTNQWAGVCMNRYIPPTKLSSTIEWNAPVRIERTEEFYQWLMCYE